MRNRSCCVVFKLAREHQSGTLGAARGKLLGKPATFEMRLARPWDSHAAFQGTRIIGVSQHRISYLRGFTSCRRPRYLISLMPERPVHS